ncbi:site-specific integrase [Pseudoflavonifractor sp. AF19-9AC]|uniref:tyrosine-type recombinase/integrase n=1 Tax=Pseudoflavonifractor sp. AF19-9AC TaxID=2292244 RepID=UPI000E480528|nr:site-specific integrase [Pseudoflavonifractor sp. AF19-9AC]RHR09961.1 site-specific integrase [Pseudoflavonifractor sp. AF19-9AC]
MGRKRKNGEGTVRLRKDGRWEGRIVIGYDENDLPKTKNVLAKTKGECIEKLKALKSTITPDTPIKLKADMPFGEWLDHWYETYCKPNARPATQRTYEGYIRLYLHPRLGSIPLNKVTTSDIQQMCTWMMTEARVDQKNGEGGLSDSQVINCYSLCDRVLEKAVAEKLIVRNPAKGCKLPPNRPNEMKVLSREDMQKVLIQAKEENYYELFLLEFATGLRLGELMALQWDDVDLVTGELRINKQVNLVGSKLVISEPKTKAAVRTLILPPSVRKVLAEYKTKVNSRWLFPSPKKDDLPIIPSAVSRRLHTLLEHAGCEQVRFHDLRHTFATNALAHGMDIKTLSTILGHVSSATTLNTYSHVTDEMRQRAAVKIDQGIAKAEVQDTAIAQPERIITSFQARKRWSREAS